MPDYEMTESQLEEVRIKRYETLIGTWESMPASNTKYFKICKHRISEIIEHYIDNLRVIKCRYKIDDEIQLHKIAGLMAYSIVKFKPISLVNEPRVDNDLYINESLAIFHGLSICGEHTEEPGESLYKNSNFDYWNKDFLYLLHKRNFTPESLSLVFETVTLYSFPNNFNVTGI